MVGFYATANESQELRIDFDNELAGRYSHSHRFHLLITLLLDARWFTREEILAVLDHPEGTNFSSASISASGEGAPPFWLPPKTAIAGILISNWAHGMPLDNHCASPRF